MTAASSLPASRGRVASSRENTWTPTLDHAHAAARTSRAGTVKMTEGTGEMPRTDPGVRTPAGAAVFPLA